MKARVGIKLKGQPNMIKIVRVVLKDDQIVEELFDQGEGALRQNVRRSTRTRTKSVRLINYENVQANQLMQKVI